MIYREMLFVHEICVSYLNLGEVSCWRLLLHFNAGGARNMK